MLAEVQRTAWLFGSLSPLERPVSVSLSQPDFCPALAVESVTLSARRAQACFCIVCIGGHLPGLLLFDSMLKRFLKRTGKHSYEPVMLRCGRGRVCVPWAEVCAGRFDSQPPRSSCANLFIVKVYLAFTFPTLLTSQRIKSKC